MYWNPPSYATGVENYNNCFLLNTNFSYNFKLARMKFLFSNATTILLFEEMMMLPVAYLKNMFPEIHVPLNDVR